MLKLRRETMRGNEVEQKKTAGKPRKKGKRERKRERKKKLIQ